jgi:hypothetical protein
MRKLKDGTEVAELDQIVELKVTTKCPDKWLLIDRETGEAYIAYSTTGKHQWKKLYNAEWTVGA